MKGRKRKEKEMKGRKRKGKGMKGREMQKKEVKGMKELSCNLQQKGYDAEPDR